MKSTEKTSIMMKVAVLAPAILTIMATAAMGPAIGIINLNFPNTNPLLLKSIVTLPALICIPISILSNKFSKHLRKKYLLILALIVFLFGAICCYFSNTIYTLLISRGIFGLGLGIIGPLSLVLVGDFFQGKERAKFMGYSSAVTNIGGVIAIVIVGFLTSFGWHNVFLIYLIAIPVLLVVIFFLPKFGPYDVNAVENRKQDVHKETEHIKLNKRVFIYVIIIILAFITFYSVPTNLALLIQNKNLGNAETSSALIAVITLFAFISSMLFEKFLKVFKEFLVIMSFILIGIGLAILLMSGSFIPMLIGIIIVGIGFGFIVPYGIYYSSKSVHPKHTSLAISMVSTSIYVGEAICPAVLDCIAKLLHLNNVIGSFYSAEILAIVAIIFSLIILIKSKKSKNAVAQ